MTEFYDPYAGVNPWAGDVGVSMDQQYQQIPWSGDLQPGEYGSYVDATRRGFEDPGYYYDLDQKAWEDEQTRKRQYWQDLLGENYDESALGALSAAPKSWNPYAAFQSNADQQEYLYGASPQNARTLPAISLGTGWGVQGGADQQSGNPGKAFTEQRPQWSDAFVSAPQPPKYEGPHPLLTMTGQPSSDGQQSSLPSMQWGGKWWEKQGQYSQGPAPERSYIQQQQSNPSAQEQQNNLARLMKLMEL
jgi:hypothetical protein